MLLVIFASAAARGGTETLIRSVCYKDGIAVGTHAQRGFILCQHEAEHHLQTDQQRMEIPNDGWLVQQCDPVGGRNAAEGRNTLRHQLLFICVKGIAIQNVPG